MLPFCGSWARFRLGWRRSPGRCGGGGVVLTGLSEGRLLSFHGNQIFICLSNSIFQNNSKRGSSFITVGIIIISIEIGDKLYFLS